MTIDETIWQHTAALSAAEAQRREDDAVMAVALHDGDPLADLWWVVAAPNPRPAIACRWPRPSQAPPQPFSGPLRNAKAH